MNVISSDKASTRQNILDAAVRIFREKGFQKARVSDIVSAAGLAQGTFYLYFKSKEEIAREICRSFMEGLTHIFDSDEDVFTSRTLEELRLRLRRMLVEALSILQADAEAAEIVLREGIGHGGLFKELYEDLIFGFIKLLRHRLENGHSRGLLHVQDPETTAVFIVSLVERSFFFFMVMRGTLDVEKIAEEMSHFMLNGLARKENEGKHSDTLQSF